MCWPHIECGSVRHPFLNESNNRVCRTDVAILMWSTHIGGESGIHPGYFFAITYLYLILIFVLCLHNRYNARLALAFEAFGMTTFKAAKEADWIELDYNSPLFSQHFDPGLAKQLNENEKTVFNKAPAELEAFQTIFDGLKAYDAEGVLMKEPSDARAFLMTIEGHYCSMATVAIFSRIGMLAEKSWPGNLLPGGDDPRPSIPRLCVQPLVNHRELSGRFDRVLQIKGSIERPLYDGQLATCLDIGEKQSQGFGSRLVGILCEQVMESGEKSFAVDTEDGFDNLLTSVGKTEMILPSGLIALYKVCTDAKLPSNSDFEKHFLTDAMKESHCAQSMCRLIASAFVLFSFNKAFNGLATHQDYIDLVERLWLTTAAQKYLQTKLGILVQITDLECFGTFEDTIWMAKILIARLGISVPVLDGLTRAYSANLAQLGLHPTRLDQLLGGWHMASKFSVGERLKPSSIVMSTSTSVQLVFPVGGKLTPDVTLALSRYSSRLQEECYEVSGSDFRSYAIHFLTFEKDKLLGLVEDFNYETQGDELVLTENAFKSCLEKIRLKFTEGFLDPVGNNSQAKVVVSLYMANKRSPKVKTNQNFVPPWKQMLDNIIPEEVPPGSPKKSPRPGSLKKMKTTPLRPIINNRNNPMRSHVSVSAALSLIIRVPTVVHVYIAIWAVWDRG
jgi:hypothetical protein